VDASRLVAQGKALFDGGAALRGRIRSHPEVLPPAVIRCTNCHARAMDPAIPGSLAPRLTHDSLLVPRLRRGGPATAYDRERFCSALRNGIDPAHVVLSVEMPLYEVTDDECAALWGYLTAGPYDAAR
jgi:hypothetical protein